MSKLIPLTQGQSAIVDDHWYPILSQWKWSCHHSGYAYRQVTESKGCYRLIFMHRLVAGAAPRQHTDHINGDTLDNRECNLRLCTAQQNLRNQKKQAGTSSQFKGVWFRKDVRRWMAGITVDYRQLHLGYFDNELDAAKAYDAAARQHFGQFARLNFPESE